MSDINCGMCNRLKKYATGEDKCKIVYESEHTLAIYPSEPYAEVHILIMTKKHFTTMFDLTDEEVAIDVMKAIKVASKEIIALKGACKLEMYLGEFQHTKHFHCHVIYDPTID